MKIGIVGNGTVGSATARAFMEWGEIRAYDDVASKRTHSLPEVLDCDLIFVCLPTPQRPGSMQCDISIVDRFFALQVPEHLGPNLSSTNFVLRSTVPIGTTEVLREKYGLDRLVHSPEFLTARCALTDAQMPARNLIGDDGDWVGSAKRWESSHVLHRLYERRFPGVPIHVMTSRESEAVKLVTNGFFAVKIAYLNEVNALVARLDNGGGMSWERVLNAVLADGRIAHSHTQVPGPDGEYGFGGACLPKDLANLICCITSEPGLDALVTGAAYARNLKDRHRNYQQ